MNKQELYQFLQEKGIEYEVVEHKAVYTIEEADALHLPYPEVGTKNLFLRDDKKKNYYLLTVQEHRTINLKELQEMLGSRKLKFASEDDLFRILKLIRGSVTPFGTLNDEERIVKVYVDDYFAGNRISSHPNENTATIFLKCDQMMELIREHGNFAEYLKFEDL